MLVVFLKERFQQFFSFARGASANVAAPRALRLTLIALFLLGGVVQAQTHRDAAKSGTRAMRAEAKRAVPYDQLSAAVRKRIWEVVENPSIYRRMPAEPMRCDPDLFVFMVRNPEVIVNIWKLMGITNVALDRIDDHAYTGSDGAGTECVLQLVHSDDHLHLLYAKGFYQGKLLRNKVRGDCVLILRTAYEQDSKGRTVIKNNLDVFLRLESAGVGLLAKTLHPLFGKMADHNFVQSTKFLGRISQSAESNAHGVQRLAERLTSIEPATQAKFSELAAAISDRAIMHESAPEAPLAKTKVARGAVSDDSLQDESGRPNRRTASQVSAPRQTLDLRR